MIDLILGAIADVRHPRFYKTELGYQGELLVRLHERLPLLDPAGQAIVEQEHQKRPAVHGINTRPDIIVHVPTAVGGNVRAGNSAVFELNYQAGPKEVADDFENLDAAMRALEYPLAVFLNVASRRTQSEHYRGLFRERLHCIATRLTGTQVHTVHSHWREGVWCRDILVDGRLTMQ